MDASRRPQTFCGFEGGGPGSTAYFEGPFSRPDIKNIQEFLVEDQEHRVYSRLEFHPEISLVFIPEFLLFLVYFHFAIHSALNVKVVGFCLEF